MTRHGKKRSNAPMTPKPPLTHFLCLPLVNASSKLQLEESLQKFTKDVRAFKKPVSMPGVEGVTLQPKPERSSPRAGSLRTKGETEDGSAPLIPDKAIRLVGTLHLTLGVMSLVAEEKVEEAIGFLKSVDFNRLISESLAPSVDTKPHDNNPDQTAQSQHTGGYSLTKSQKPAELTNETASSTPSIGKQRAATPDPLMISLTSLTSMHPAHNTSILYASPTDPTSRLLPFCTRLVALFRSAGLLLPDDRPLKLHATIVNTIYAKTGGRAGHGHGPRARAPLRLDATAVLERFRDWVWARDVRLEKVAICKMGATKVLGEGGEVVAEEYEEVASVELPA